MDKAEMQDLENLSDFRPDWANKCSVCNATPVVPAVGLCGPCTWGDSETINGGWWDDESEARYQALIATSDAEGR